MLNTYDDHHPNAPWNREQNEPLSELEQLQEDYNELRHNANNAKAIIKFCLDVTGDNTLIYNKLKSIKL